VIQDLVLKNRSYRRFDQSYAIDEVTLRALVDLARLTPSAANLQPMKYILSCTPEKNNLIYPHLKWAAYLRDWDGPQEGERPSAYVVVLGDSEIRKDFGCDHGIVSQTIMLGAAEKGLGGCMIASVQRDELRSALNIPAHLEVLLVLAIGKPVEQVVLDPIGSDCSIKYWRDEQQIHHVPKRALDEIILP
jgi:nitroreductase